MESGEIHVRIRSEGGTYWATVDEYPGVMATGDTLDELRESVAEGIALVITEPGDPLPRLSVGELVVPEQVATAELVCA